MKTVRLALLGALLLPLACTRTVVVSSDPQPAPPPPSQPPVRAPEPPRERERLRPATAATLGIPGGHLPRAGECRIWIPGVPPGRQRSARSRSCVGIGREAPAASWIVYRPTRDHKLVHIRVLDQRRPGVVVVVHVFDVDSGRFLRDEALDVDPDDERDRRDGLAPVSRPAQPRNADPRRTPQERPRPTDVAPAPAPVPVAPAPAEPIEHPGPARPTKPDSQPQPPAPRGPFEPQRPSPVARLDIPRGHLPEPGECRVWIPDVPPGRQPHRASEDCVATTRQAPAASWVVHRPRGNPKDVHVRIIHAQRAGQVVLVRVFDLETKELVREDRP